MKIGKRVIIHQSFIKRRHNKIRSTFTKEVAVCKILWLRQFFKAMKKYPTANFVNVTICFNRFSAYFKKY